MVTNLMVRLVKAPEKKEGWHTSTLCAPKNTPAHLVFTSRHHQASPAPVSPDKNGGHYALRFRASLIERTFAALLIGVKN